MRSSWPGRLALAWVLVAAAPAFAARSGSGEGRIAGTWRGLVHYKRTGASIAGSRQVGDKTEVAVHLGRRGKGWPIEHYTLRKGEWKTVGTDRGVIVRVGVDEALGPALERSFHLAHQPWRRASTREIFAGIDQGGPDKPIDVTDRVLDEIHSRYRAYEIDGYGLYLADGQPQGGIWRLGQQLVLSPEIFDDPSRITDPPIGRDEIVLEDRGLVRIFERVRTYPKGPTLAGRLRFAPRLDLSNETAVELGGLAGVRFSLSVRRGRPHTFTIVTAAE
jgi:hypothetical protein